MPPSLVVTGGSSGIGAACARLYLARGWRVAAISRRGEAPAGATAIAADLSQEAGVNAAAGAVAGWLGSGSGGGAAGLDALIHAAGDFLVRPIADTAPAEFERIWRITVWAKFALTRALLPLLRAGADTAPPKAIVLVASLAAHQDFPQETAYMSAMHAVVGLARAQDAELRPLRIRAAVLSPGLVRTALTERSFAPPVLATALEPDAMASSAAYLIDTIRAGGYIPEIFHVPQNSR
ncbi:MAG: SDR family oxidoreductase [Terriglobales bacterium]